MKYMVMPVSPINEKASLDTLKKYFGDYFYQIGLAAAGAGIKFGYHNHDYEFKQIEGQTIYDLMLENSSPDHIMFEMDVYWVMRGGKDPVEYLNQWNSDQNNGDQQCLPCIQFFLIFHKK